MENNLKIENKNIYFLKLQDGDSNMNITFILILLETIKGKIYRDYIEKN